VRRTEEGGGVVEFRKADVGVVEMRKAVLVGVDESAEDDKGTAVGVEEVEEGVGRAACDVSGRAQNFTLPQLHVTKKFSKKWTSDTGSWCVLCSTSGWILGTSFRPRLSTVGAPTLLYYYHHY
jgi:hypothetical protein